MNKKNYKNKYWRLLKVIKESLDNNPYTSDTQVKAYQQMLGLNGNKKAQIELMKTLKKELKQYFRRIGTHG
tara:strand:+ start:3915 stop:4127 length:213 start_codon:yes stop_codon:yes gene_type:complete